MCAQWILYGTLHLPLILLLRPHLRDCEAWMVRGDRPSLVAANHATYADAFFFLLVPIRLARKLIPVVCPTSERMYRRWWPLIAPLGAYPLPPFAWSFDEYLGRTVRLLCSGYTVLLFPEGRLNRTRKYAGKAKPGIGYLTQQAGAPIYPVLVSLGTGRGGADHVRDTVTMTFGKPLDVQTAERTAKAYRGMADRVLRHIYDLAEKR